MMNVVENGHVSAKNKECVKIDKLHPDSRHYIRLNNIDKELGIKWLSSIVVF